MFSVNYFQIFHSNGEKRKIRYYLIDLHTLMEVKGALKSAGSKKMNSRTAQKEEFDSLNISQQKVFI